MGARTGAWLVQALQRCRPSQLVLGLTVVLLAVTAALWTQLWPGDEVLRDYHVWWPVLVVMFAVAEVVVVHVQVNRQAQTVALAEIPLVLGLMCAEPVELITARVVGSLVAFVLFRKQPWLKTVFNTALVLLGTSVALAVFLPLAGRRGRLAQGTRLRLAASLMTFESTKPGMSIS